MASSDLYIHYQQQARESNKASDFDHIIESAYWDYVTGRLTDSEYGRIYFACIARQNNF